MAQSSENYSKAVDLEKYSCKYSWCLSSSESFRNWWKYAYHWNQNHFDFLYEIPFMCVGFTTYDLYYHEFESAEIIWNLQWHIFFSLAEINRGHRIPLRKRSVTYSKLHQGYGPNFFQYDRPSPVRASKAWVSQRNNFLLKKALNAQFKEIKFGYLLKKNTHILKKQLT